MKALSIISNEGSGVSTGRVSRRQSDHGNAENAEIKMYLSKLKDLVPFMPKNRKLSKLEIIQNVIDYICDLQNELETHPAISAAFDVSTVLSVDEQEFNYYNQRNRNNTSNNFNNGISNSPSSHYHYIRRPLVDRSSPNTILSDNEIHQQNLINNQQLIHSHSMADKST